MENYYESIEKDVENKGKKKVNKKKVLIGVGILGAIIAAVVIFFVIRNDDTKKLEIVTYYDKDENITRVHVNDRLVGEMEGDCYLAMRNMNDTGIYFSNDNSTIYVLDKKQIKEVSKAMNIVTVANHANVALMTNDEGHLYRYDGKKVQVVIDEAVECAAISGNGKTYAYTVDGDSYFGNKIGKETKVEDCFITYLSDNGKLIYGLSGDESLQESDFMGDLYRMRELYLQDNTNLIRIDDSGKKEEIAESVLTIHGLNEDGTELVYGTNDGTYILVDGKDNKKISDDELVYISYYNSDYILYGNYNTVESMKDTLLLFKNDSGSSKCCYLSDKYENVNVLDECAFILGVDKDLTKIIYITEDYKLIYANVEEDAETEVLCDDSSNAVMTFDGEDIYYVSLDGKMELHHVDKDLKDSVVMELSSLSGFEVVDDGCYIKAGSIYYLNGDKATEVSSEGDIEMDYYSKKAYMTIKYEYVDKDTELYSLDGGEKKQIE